MSITLTPDVEKLVRESVERGEYDGPDALVVEAVRRLIEEDTEEDSHQDEIRARVEAAEAEVDRGEYIEYDADTIHGLAKDVHQRGLNRLAAEREKTGTRLLPPGIDMVDPGHITCGTAGRGPRTRQAARRPQYACIRFRGPR
jgi:Arc/MetJ-type ribon-helix-helix transcriptional regulator